MCAAAIGCVHWASVAARSRSLSTTVLSGLRDRHVRPCRGRIRLVKASPLHRSAPLSVCIRLVDEYMVSDAVPGVVNADEEQQQRRRSNTKQDFARVVGSR